MSERIENKKGCGADSHARSLIGLCAEAAKRRSARRTPGGGQAILEFALVLPILFLILYGFIEVGRAIFMYASLITASREAVRYGSTIGHPDSVPNYQNCAGIVGRAQKVGFMLHLEKEDAVIAYDDGPGTAIKDYCDDLSDGTEDGIDTDVVLESGDRVLVELTLAYSPIIRYQSFEPRTFVTSTARTIMGVVEVSELESP